MYAYHLQSPLNLTGREMVEYSVYNLALALNTHISRFTAHLNLSSFPFLVIAVNRTFFGCFWQRYFEDCSNKFVQQKGMKVV